jgi:hypothetical protein
MNIKMISSQRTHSQRGQTFLIIAVFIGVFLLAVMGLATDYAQIWAHRQIAQGAADAACQAGAADLLLYFEDSTSTYSTANSPWITSGGYDCSAHTSSSPCKYAAQNGYTGSNVSVSFPSSLPNAPAIPSGYGTITHPYIQVSITDAVPMFFTKLVSSVTTVSTSVKAGCGIVAVDAAVPLAVLSPTAGPSLSLSGAMSSIKIYGGPQRSIEVNSHSTSALGSGGSIDLSQAGPSYTGGDIGVFGIEAKPGNLTLGSGHYLDPAAPISDPFANVPAPAAQPAGGSSSVLYHTNGCPDTGGCTQFVPGNYPAGLTAGMGTSIFDPGIYYVHGNLLFDTLSNVRPSAKNATTAPYGTIFYITGCTTKCISVKSNSGKSTSLDAFSSSTLTCPGGTAYAAPPGVAPPTQGNILMAPCSGTYGDPSGLYRGILFYVDHSISGATASWGGGGSFILAGAIYVHSTAYNDVFNMGGNSGSTSMVIGNMIVDTLGNAGNPSITMQLNPNSSYPILEVELLE